MTKWFLPPQKLKRLLVLVLPLLTVIVAFPVSAAVAVTSVELDYQAARIAPAETLQLTASVLPLNATDKSVTWSSDNSSYATVSSSGLVTGVATGTANITVTTTDGARTATIPVSVGVGVTGVSLDKSSATVAVGYSGSPFVATVSPSNAVDKTLTWVSSDSSIVSVNGATLTAVAVGTARISAWTRDGMFLAEADLIVYIPVTGVTLDSAQVILMPSETMKLNETIAPVTATDKSVAWSSSNTSIATVSSSGLVTAVANGSATITVTSTDGSRTATAAVTVTRSVASVTLDQTSVVLTAGQTSTLVPTVLPSTASEKRVSWTSSASSIATVSPNGIVTAVSVGVATITATTTDGGFTATASIHVTTSQSVTGITLAQTTANIGLNDAIALQAQVAPSNASDKSVQWATSNSSVATVGSNGLVTGVAAGIVTITATTADGGFTATATINVAKVTSVSFDVVSMSIPRATSVAMTANVAPIEAANKTVNWTSTSTSVATVSAQGLIVAVSAGTSTIRATTVDGSFTTTLSLTVTAQTIPVDGAYFADATVNLIPNEQFAADGGVTPSNASNQNVTWTSLNTSIATVTSQGIVSAVSNGTTSIKIVSTDGSFEATMQVVVSTILVPTAPLITNVSSGINSLTITFVRINNSLFGNSISYVVTASSGGSSSSCLVASTATDSSCIISSLTSGVVYSISVTASNSAGTSAPTVSTATSADRTPAAIPTTTTLPPATTVAPPPPTTTTVPAPSVAAVPVKTISTWTAATVSAMAPETAATLTSTQVVALKPAAVAGLQGVQLDAMPAKAVAAITATQAKSLKPAAVANMGDAITQLAPRTLAALSISALKAAKSNEFVDNLTTKQIAALKATQVKALGLDKVKTLTAAQKKAVTAALKRK